MMKSLLLAAISVIALAGCAQPGSDQHPPLVAAAPNSAFDTAIYAQRRLSQCESGFYAICHYACKVDNDQRACSKEKEITVDNARADRERQQAHPAIEEQRIAEHRSEIALHTAGGTFTVPVSINGTITLDFTLDSGAADVSIPADVVMTLMRTGTIDRGDFLGSRTYVMADGSTAPSTTFRIRSLRVGNHEVRNVTGSIAPVKGGLLLGQSFLRQFGSWSIDNRRGVLVLD